MTAARPRPHAHLPRRRFALASLAVLAALLAGVLGLAGLLRQPMPAERAGLSGPAVADPREPFDCLEPRPVEGAGRPSAEVRPSLPAITVTSGDLHGCPESWHHRRVRYRGEAVGALLRRSTGVWVQLNDDVYAGLDGAGPRHGLRGGNSGVGVLLPPALADRIRRLGGPEGRGDVLEVEGTYHRIMPDSGQVAVIVAARGEVVAAGRPYERPLSPERVPVAAALAALAAVTAAAERAVTRRRG